MKWRNVLNTRNAVRRGVQDLVSDFERPLLLPVAGDAVMTVKLVDGGKREKR